MQPHKFGDGTKLRGVVETADEEWSHRNVMKFNMAKCKVLHLGQGKPWYKHRPGDEQKIEACEGHIYNYCTAKKGVFTSVTFNLTFSPQMSCYPQTTSMIFLNFSTPWKSGSPLLVRY